jgi:hypothetical protein
MILKKSGSKIKEFICQENSLIYDRGITSALSIGQKKSVSKDLFNRKVLGEYAKATKLSH